MPLIKNQFIERIHEEVDIVKVFQAAGIELQRRGKDYFCKSPFTQERTASCAVSPSKQIYKDFSSGKGGGAISFVMEYFQKSFPEAIEHIARDMNLKVEYDNSEQAKKAVERKERVEGLRPILKAAHRKYQEKLQSLPDGHPAWAELRRRGYSAEEITIYGIGYAPGGTFLYDKLREVGRIKEGRTLGLIGDSKDKFWDRLIYPLYDKNGLIVGFAGRDLTGRDRTAKWLNSQESEVYRKDKTLYGLHLAKQEISRENAVYIVEGYNDVIAWQQNGLLNTVAPCGTALTDRQIQLLHRLTDKVILCLDGDAAGQKSVLRTLPGLIKRGFSTEVIDLEGLDPDDFIRQRRSDIYQAAVHTLIKRAAVVEQHTFGLRPNVNPAQLQKANLQKIGLRNMMQDKQRKQNGFQVLLNAWLKQEEDVARRGKRITELAQIIAAVDDEYMHMTYSGWLAKESGHKPTEIKRLIESAKKDLKDQDAYSDSEMYLLPKELEGKVNMKEMEPIINRYGLMIAGRKIWMKRGTEAPYVFEAVSNFSVEIIQHMQDEKFPMKLMRIVNVANKEKIFDVPSENLMTPLAFRTAMAAHGNFLYKGGNNDHNSVLQYLFDRMGDGEKIDVLGWQRAGFFVFNNRVVIPGHGEMEPDENGVFKIKDAEREISYYVPSANRVYANNPYKYQSQKRVVVKGDSSLTFNQFTSQMMKVHRQHAITGILFSVASIFQDVVVHEMQSFPIVFLYGPPGSGKDQLISCCQSFFGDPQEGINLEGGASTIKAKLRELAQFSNLISHLSEYRRGDKSQDGILKGMWDRRGYKRGTLDSHVSSESIPVLSSVFLTGNDYPDDDALITRLIWEEMTKSDFSPEDKQNFEKLQDMVQRGVSHLTVEILKHRQVWVDNFKRKFREVNSALSKELDLEDSTSRITSNMSVLATTYELMKDHLQFPFGYQDIRAHFTEIGAFQVRKLNTASVYVKWWDCFLSACRTRQEPLRVGVDYDIRDGRLYFNFTNAYNRVSQQWYRMYYESAPGKSKMSDTLRDSTELDLQQLASFRFGEGSRTSAWNVKLQATGVKGELEESIEWQRNQLGAISTPSPATPNDEKSGDSPTGDELPF